MKLIADTHCHTLASTHAYSTILENAKFASEIGLKYLAITDHASTLPDAPHPWHFNCLNMIPAEIYCVKMLVGIEANILNTNGDIDIVNDVKRIMKWVVASLHEPVFAPSNFDDHTTAVINTIKQNPIVDTVGHLDSALYPCDLEKIVKTFKEYNRPIEINENSLKKGNHIKNGIELANLCKKYDTSVIINSDAHFALNIAQVPTAQKMLSELDFPTNLIINSNIDLFENYLKTRSER